MFHDIAYKAKDRQDLLAGIEEFLDEVIVLPPVEWDPDIRIEPPKSLPSSDKRYSTATQYDKHTFDEKALNAKSNLECSKSVLQRS